MVFSIETKIDQKRRGRETFSKRNQANTKQQVHESQKKTEGH